MAIPWNEFDLAVMEVAAELKNCGDFSTAVYSLPRAAGLGGPLETVIHLTCARTGTEYQIPIIETIELECAEVVIVCNVETGFKPGSTVPPQTPPRYLFFDYENIYRCLFLMADNRNQKKEDRSER